MSPACRKCGDLFESDRSHHRYCWPCYWEFRDGRRWTTGDTWREPPSHWGESRTAPGPPPLDLDPRLLRDAISLTHPDRHPVERSKVANAVTAALLELLNTVRGKTR